MLRWSCTQWIEPFICQTDAFKLPDGTTLGKPLDENCSAKTIVQYVYRTTGDKPEFKPLAIHQKLRVARLSSVAAVVIAPREQAAETSHDDEQPCGPPHQRDDQHRDEEQVHG
jgi:hypothetical protein